MRFLILFLIFLITLTAAPSYVQGAHDEDAGGTVALAYGSNVTSGNLLIAVVGIGGGSSGSVSSVTDSQGNTYTDVGVQINASNIVGLQVYYTIAGSTGANTVTVVNPTTSTELIILEYGGMTDTINVSATDSDVNDTSGTTSTGNMISSSSDVLVLGIAAASGTGFTLDAAYNDRGFSNYSCVHVCMNMGDKNGGAATHNVSWTWTPGLKHTAVQGVVFEASAVVNNKKRVIVF